MLINGDEGDEVTRVVRVITAFMVIGTLCLMYAFQNVPTYSRDTKMT